MNVERGQSHETQIEPDFLLKAYQIGVFPMAMENEEIGWFSPDPRGVIPIEEFHVPHGLKRTLRKDPFEIRYNSDFEGVMRGCADRSSTWIDEVILSSYCQLHEMGFAHSVETWKEDELVGGLYGVSIGGAFFGESMFSRRTDASKVALYYLVERLKKRRFILLDTQWTTPHLEQFGALEIPRSRYLDILAEAVTIGTSFGDRSPDDLLL